MAEIAAAKSPKKFGQPVPSAPVERTLREVQPKKFGMMTSQLQFIGHDYSLLTIKVPADWTFEDVLKPEAWVNVCWRVAKDQTNTRIDSAGSIIQAHHKEWLAELYIQEVIYDHLKSACGLKVTCIGPVCDPKTGKACPIDIATGLPWQPKKAVADA